MQYLHSKKICHRDLKPENILLCSLDDKNPVIKITDMGLSKLVDLGTVLKTFCGTPQYIAPEVIKGSSVFGGPKPYSLKVDCWGLGVILYILLSGTPPFSEDRRIKQELKDQILTANYTFYPQLFDSISVEAKDLIQKCLKVEPSERISAEEIMNHPWLTNDSDVIERARVLMSSQMKGKKRLLVRFNKFAVVLNCSVSTFRRSVTTLLTAAMAMTQRNIEMKAKYLSRKKIRTQIGLQ